MPKMRIPKTRQDLRARRHLRVRKALSGARAGSLLIVQCTDPMAAIDLPNLARETGSAIERQGDADGTLVFHIRKAA